MGCLFITLIVAGVVLDKSHKADSTNISGKEVGTRFYNARDMSRFRNKNKGPRHRL